MNFRLSRFETGIATCAVEKSLRAPIELEAEHSGLRLALLSPCCEAQVFQGQNASCIGCGEILYLACSSTREWDYLDYYRDGTIEWLEQACESLYGLDPLTAVLEASEYIAVIQEFNDLMLALPRSQRLSSRATAQEARRLAQQVLAHTLMPAQ